MSIVYHNIIKIDVSTDQMPQTRVFMSKPSLQISLLIYITFLSQYPQIPSGAITDVCKLYSHQIF